MFAASKTNRRIALLMIIVTMRLCPIAQAQNAIGIEWYSEGTFDFNNLPGPSGFNTFSSSAPLELTDVRFDHAAFEGSQAEGFVLYQGTFEITAANGDVLQGYLFPEFHFNADLDMDNVQDGASFFIVTGGTGRFADVFDGGGLLIGTAHFSDPTSGTVEYYWEGSLYFAPEPSSAILAGFPLALLFAARPNRCRPPSPNRQAPGCRCRQRPACLLGKAFVSKTHSALRNAKNRPGLLKSTSFR